MYTSVDQPVSSRRLMMNDDGKAEDRFLLWTYLWTVLTCLRLLLKMMRLVEIQTPRLRVQPGGEDEGEMNK